MKNLIEVKKRGNYQKVYVDGEVMATYSFKTGRMFGATDYFRYLSAATARCTEGSDTTEKRKTVAETIMEIAQKDRVSNDHDCGFVNTVDTRGAHSSICVQDKYLSLETCVHGCEEAPTTERKTLDDGTVFYKVTAKTRREDGTLITAELITFMK